MTCAGFDQCFDSDKWPLVPFVPTPQELKGADAGHLRCGRQRMIEYQVGAMERSRPGSRGAGASAPMGLRHPQRPQARILAEGEECARVAQRRQPGWESHRIVTADSKKAPLREPKCLI